MKITSDQRQRLSALYGKGDSLDAAETAERDVLANWAGEDDAASIQAEAEAAHEDGGDGGEDDGGAAPEAGSLTVGQRISAMVSSNKALAGKIAGANQREAQAVADLTAMTERAETAEGSLEASTSKLATADTTIAALKGEAKTTDEAVTQALAGLNIPRAKLPKAGGGDSADVTLEKLNAEIEAEEDPLRKGQLSQQAWDLMKAQAKGGNS